VLRKAISNSFGVSVDQIMQQATNDVPHVAGESKRDKVRDKT